MYKKFLYAENKKEHFKIWGVIPECNLLLKIYLTEMNEKVYGIDNCPLIFNKLVNMYKKEMPEKKALYHAAKTMNDFFTACDELTKEKTYPFKMNVSFLDPNIFGFRFKNMKESEISKPSFYFVNNMLSMLFNNFNTTFLNFLSGNVNFLNLFKSSKSSNKTKSEPTMHPILQDNPDAQAFATVEQDSKQKPKCKTKQQEKKSESKQEKKSTKAKATTKQTTKIKPSKTKVKG